MTPERFAELMGGLLCATNHKMDAKGIEVWRRLLADIPDEVLVKAFHRVACECSAFPSVKTVRDAAAEVQHGAIDTQGDTFGRVKDAITKFGPCLPCVPKCDKCRADLARKHIGELGWQAVQALGGWSVVCDTTSDQMPTVRAQYRDAYRAAGEREKQLRALPESLRPRIDNTPVAGLPEPKPEPLALPAPEQPTAEQVDSARLRVFRTPEPEPMDDAAVEANRQRQIEAAKRMRGAS